MTDPNPSFSRRAMLAAAFVGGSAAAAALSGAPAAQAAPGNAKKQFNLTVLGTTDLHNNVHNSDTVKHPMALAMNAVGYDAVALGNHEFNYGIPMLRTWEKQLDFPLLGANVHDAVSGGRAFTPYVLKRVKTGNGWVTVGLVGFVTPGCALWDRDNVQGKLDFNGIVEEARVVIPQMKAAGADVIIVSSHSGATPGSSYGDALPFAENASTQLAEEVPGIDAILVGHAHLEIPERFVTNKETKRPVLLTEPLKWGMRVAVIDLQLSKDEGRWTVTSAHS